MHSNHQRSCCRSIPAISTTIRIRSIKSSKCLRKSTIYPSQIRKLWESFKTGEPYIDKTERFKTYKLISQSHNCGTPAIVQVQFCNLKWEWISVMIIHVTERRQNRRDNLNRKWRQMTRALMLGSSDVSRSFTFLWAFLDSIMWHQKCCPLKSFIWRDGLEWRSSAKLPENEQNAP